MNLLCQNSQLIITFDKLVIHGALRISDHHGQIVGFYRLKHNNLFNFELDVPNGTYQAVIETDYYRDEKYFSVVRNAS